MGVLGLTPFIQKTCPDVIKTLHNRLQSLRGKTIVIDGTLITQRLHFAPIPHPYRHILGWFRIIQEMKECDIHPICVFDGKERSLAKQSEIERRKQARMESVARGSFEFDRLQRLRNLSTVLSTLQQSGSTEQDRALFQLKDTFINIPERGKDPIAADMQETTYDFRGSPNVEQSYNTEDQYETLAEAEISEILSRAEAPVSTRHAAELEPPPEEAFTTSIDTEGTDIQQDDDPDSLLSQLDQAQTSQSDLPETQPEILAEILAEDYRSSTVHPDAMPDEPYSQSDDESFSQSDDESFSQSDDSPDFQSGDAPLDYFPFLKSDIDMTEPAVDSVPVTLTSLYLDYRRSMPEAAYLPEPPTTASPSVASPSVASPTVASATTVPVPVLEDMTIAQKEYSISKTQHHLTSEEGVLWNQLVGSTISESELDADSFKDRAASLAQKSMSLSESYERRTNPPSAWTYAESKTILHALGVPTVESSGPYEAEALASSLVVNGYADFVASEDTDVLIFEVPLIRNISNRVGPVVVISGSDVRENLQLSRSSYIDFALLLGTDFSPRIKNVGPTRALKFIREYDSIERILERETKFPPRMPQQTYLEKIALARSVFTTLPPVPDAELLKPQESDEEEVAAILKFYGLQHAVAEEFIHNALGENLFQDSPAAS